MKVRTDEISRCVWIKLRGKNVYAESRRAQANASMPASKAEYMKIIPCCLSIMMSFICEFILFHGPR